MDIADQTFSNRDEFQRKNIAEKVLKLLKSDIDISPMVIDGGWGAGKSEFCHKLINLSKEQGDAYQHVYIDAYRADHADEPLLTVLAAVLKLVPVAERQEVIKKVMPALRYSLKAMGKAALSHVLRQDIDGLTENFEKEISEAAGKAIDSSVEGLLKDHIEADKNLELLQSSLAEIATKKSILIFVDELDRCRPNFAVDMLEVIKHTFNVENVQFVLITNTQQLKAAINNIYGGEVDAQRYLDKFLKYTLSLSPTFNHRGDTQFQTSLLHYFKLIDKSVLLKNKELDKSMEGELVRNMIKTHKWSLREVESFVRYLEIYQVLTDNNGLYENQKSFLRTLKILGVMLSVFNPSLGQSMLNGRADGKELGQFFDVLNVPLSIQPRPNPYRLMAIALGQECHINSKDFTPTEDSEKWESLFDTLFSNDWESPEKGCRSLLVLEVFEILAFK